MTMLTKLYAIQGPLKGKSRALPIGEYVLGRGENCDIRVADERVSLTHAKLRVSNPDVSVEDLNSMNGTYVNDLERRNRVTFDRLEDRDTLALGPETAFGIRILEMRSAGFWSRCAALLIDAVLVFSLLLLGALFLGALIGVSNAQVGGIMDFGRRLQVEAEARAVGAIWMSIGAILVPFLYTVLMNGARGQTLGKMAMKIKIVRTDGNEIAYGTAFLRCFVQSLMNGCLLGVGFWVATESGLREFWWFFGALALGIVYIPLTVHPEKRGWYDMIADTRVVHCDSL
jgi:uncharacterized RDD family membrane protein YckC